MVNIKQIQAVGTKAYKITKEALSAIIKFLDFVEDNKEELKKVSRVTVKIYKWVARKIINKSTI